MTYDPTRDGARCEICVLRKLREGNPVPSEFHREAIGTAVAEAPGRMEVARSRPLVGDSGLEYEAALTALGRKRNSLHVINALSCRPPDNELARVMSRLKTLNDKREAAGLEKLPPPITCCAPRVEHDLRHANKIAPGSGSRLILMGKIALEAITGRRSPILEIRGAPITSMPGVLIMPTTHPAFVLRVRRWTKVFRADIGRAFRWFETGKINWLEPRVLRRPTPDQLRRWLLQMPSQWKGDPKNFSAVTYDTETTMDGGPMWNKLRCIGFGKLDHDERGMGILFVPVLSVDGVHRFYAPNDEREIKQVMRELFARPDIEKYGHNCLYTGTPVVLADGSSMPINEIVAQRLNVTVKGTDAVGNIVDARVVDWVRQSRKGQSWIVVKPVGMKGGARGLTLTPDHEVYTQRGRVRADALMKGDKLRWPEALLTAWQRSAIIGTLLGDSTLHTSPTVDRTHAIAASLHVGHIHSCNLVQRKEQALGVLPYTNDYEGGGFAGVGKSRLMRQARSETLRQLADLFPLVYAADRRGRRVTQEALDALDARGLAWWFMDDGFKNKRPDNDPHNRREAVSLAVQRYPIEDQERTRAWFEKKFGRTTLYSTGTIRLGADASAFFAAHIAPHVFTEMRYKLPRTGVWPEYVPELTVTAMPPIEVEIEDVFPYASDKETSYCLTTETGNFFTAFGLVKNCGYFDETVMGEYLAEDDTRRADGAHARPFNTFTNRNDTIILHRAVESELPHKLGFVGSAYTDAPGAWKAAHTATEAASDVELANYNVIDVAISARIIPPLHEAVSMREQEDVVRKDYKLQEIARGLHRNGVPVHEPTRAAWEIKFRNEAGVRDETTGYVPANTLLKKLCDIAGEPDLNPRSTQQLRALIFSRWGLTPAMDPEGRKPLLTKAGYPSTSNAAILELRRRGDASPRAIEFIDTLRKYRKKSKLLGTYIMRLAPREARASFTEMDAARALEMEEGGDAAPAAGSEASLTLTDDGRIETAQRLGGANFIDPSGGLFDENEEVEEGRVTRAGRVHCNVNVHTPKTGRFSMTKPGMQTFPRELRDIFRAPDGWTFVIADKDQIELRHTVVRAGAKKYLEVFAQKKEKIHNPDGTWLVRGDPHSHAAASTFGERFTRLVPESSDWEKIRDFTKKLVYASAYLAQPPTIHRLITSVEDMNGNLLYADMPLLQVAELRTNWLRDNAEIEPWWQMELQEFRAQGYRRDAVWGRRCDFLDGENENEIVNFDEQAGCAAIVHDDTFALLDAIPFEKWGPYSGLCHQEHDKLIVQCPVAQAEWVSGVMSECMNRTVRELPGIKFSAKPKISKTFKA